MKNSEDGIWRERRFFSLTVSVLLVLSALLVGISTQVPNASAPALNHDVGNLEVNMLTDYGRILMPLYRGGHQTAQDDTTIAFIGLVIDQDNYDHTPGAEDIADCFNTCPYLSMDDFTVVKPITMVINNGVTQKSIAEFQNTGGGTGDPNDILINQTCWTVVNKDWAILQWTLINIKSPASDLTNVRIGLEVPISKEGSKYGLGGNLVDSGDDVDGYDMGNAVYWAQDLGDGTTIGFASAIASDPITHYYAEDYHADYSSEYVNFFGIDTWLYQRLIAPSATATNGITPGNITATVGWDGFDILAGESRTVALAIAINNTYGGMITALNDAQYYYSKFLPPTPPTGLQANLVSNGKDVMVSWDASADDGSGYNDVAGYTIYKSITGVDGNYEFAGWVPAIGFPSYYWVDINAGDGDWNDYFYIVRANDTFNSEEQNTNKVGKVVDYLEGGWNLISIPLVQSNTSKDHVLQTLKGNYTALQAYHSGKSKPWLHWHKDKPEYLNSVIEIELEYGYYIYILNPDHLIIAGRIPETTQISLEGGWNLVGYPSLTSYNRSATLNNLNYPADVNSIWTYNTATQKWEEIEEPDYFESSRGYWLHALANKTWEGPP
jgi:hypothetical protein